MSGIAGFVRFDGQKADHVLLENMVTAIKHRGPDKTGYRIKDSAAFACNLLFTTSESVHEKLPGEDAGGRYLITADARIDNRDDLIARLYSESKAAPVTDSELILAAYEAWGDDCVRHLLGDFAFVILDSRRKVLFAARDHFGVKPFDYYFREGQIFAFASEIKALWALDEVPREINETRLADFLVLLLSNQSETSFQHIFRLPPAHVLKIEDGRLDIQKYWELDPELEVRFESEEEYVAEFRRIFFEAVRCRLRSAYPVGTQLSGGIDSSSVTCVAQQLLKREQKLPLHTLSSVFDIVTECDERPYIQSVLDGGDYTPHYTQADRVGPLTDFDRVTENEDEVGLGPNHYLVWIINELARDAGIRVVLDGFDGDTTIAHGYERLTELALGGNWNSFVEEAHSIIKVFGTGKTRTLFQHYAAPFLFQPGWRLKSISMLFPAYRAARRLGVQAGTFAKEYVIKKFVPAGVKKARQQLRSRQTDPKQPGHVIQYGRDRVLKIIDPHFARKTKVDEREQKNKKQRFSLPASVREFQYKAFTEGTFSFVLEMYDRSTATYGIEMRHPFLDVRLVEFCLALPSRFKLRNGWARWIIREALSGVLPENIRWRPGKANMELNLFRGITQLNRQEFDEIVYGDLSDVAGFLDVTELRNTYERVIRSTRFESHDINGLWRGISVIRWLRKTNRNLEQLVSTKVEQETV